MSILEARAGQSIVVVDEAYIEFCDAPSATELVASFDNLVVLRTLSKALAFAGARCGCVVGSKEVVDMIDAVQPPYALATPVVECVENALEGDTLQEAEQLVAQTIGERDRLVADLKGFNFVTRVWPSAANFILAEVADANALMRHCADDGLLLRYFGGDLGKCVRITIGSPSENDRLLESMQRLEADNG